MLVSEKSRFLLLMFLAAYAFHELRVTASLCALFVMPFLVLKKKMVSCSLDYHCFDCCIQLVCFIA